MMFYPRAKRKDICDGADPSIRCVAREKDCQAGAFYYDSRRQGYCSTELVAGPWGIPTLLDACPFCCELLPGPEARRRWETKLNTETKPAPEQPTEFPIMGEMDVYGVDEDSGG